MAPWLKHCLAWLLWLGVAFTGGIIVIAVVREHGSAAVLFFATPMAVLLTFS